MTEQERAGEQLKVIRTLMERATVYRALSWQTALFGGALAIILSTVLFLREQGVVKNETEASHAFMSEWGWVLTWVIALIVVLGFNALLIAKKSKKGGREFFSPGLKMVMRSIIPPMVIGGVLGIGRALSSEGSTAEAAAVWVCCYGLALAATAGIAPKSIPRLGWVFIIAGILVYAFVWGEGARPLPGGAMAQRLESPLLESNLIMGICFGLFHLIYGYIVMKANGGAAEEPDEE
jgi:hypothetical protein